MISNLNYRIDMEDDSDENKRVIKDQNYDKASELLGKLFSSSPDVMDQLNSCIRVGGAAGFFDNIETFDFSPEMVEKLKAVRDVLFGTGDYEPPLENTRTLGPGRKGDGCSE